MIFASFQDFGRCDNRRQCLDKCAKYASNLLGRSLKNSSGIPSIPQAFISLNNFINFLYSIQSDSIRGLIVYGFEQTLNSSLQPPFMVAVKQVMMCRLIFQSVSYLVDFT
jgi:hypothetical protein